MFNIVRAEDNDFCTLPDDGFYHYGKPLTHWVALGNERDAQKRKKWAEAAEQKMYLECPDAILDARHEPYVIENYRADLKNGSISPVETFFVFKCENNGSTYVLHTTDIQYDYNREILNLPTLESR